MGWCNDNDSKLYNKQIILDNKINSENYLEKTINIIILLKYYITEKR